MTDTHTTAHIPDEAVRAAIKSFQSTDNNCETYQDMRKAITAALPHLSAPCAVEVRDIEEKLLSEMSRRFHNEKYLWDSEKDFYPNPEYLPVDDTQIGIEFALEFMKPFLSCVVTMPVDVAAVRRQAFEEAATLLDEGFEMPVEKAWRNDGQPSKNDKCPHDKFMYEDCMICASAAIRALSAAPTSEAGK